MADLLPHGYDAETARCLAAIAHGRPKPRCEHPTTDAMIAAANTAPPSIRPPADPLPEAWDPDFVDRIYGRAA